MEDETTWEYGIVKYGEYYFWAEIYKFEGEDAFAPISGAFETLKEAQQELTALNKAKKNVIEIA